MTVLCDDLREPQTLREVLDLFGRLRHHDGLKKAIAEHIQSQISEFLLPNGFYSVPIKEILVDLFDTLGMLHQKLLKNPITFGIYETMLPITQSCVSRLSDVIIKFLPVLNSDLMTLHYHGALECRFIGGHRWGNEKFGSVNPAAPLHMWLTDVIGKEGEGYDLMRRGFHGYDLCNVNTSEKVCEYSGISLNGEGLLTLGQYGNFFISKEKFQPNELFGAMLFIDEFCQEVNKGSSGMFHHYMASLPNGARQLIDGCRLIPVTLSPLLEDTFFSPYGMQGLTRCVECEDTGRRFKNIYEGKLKVDAFPKYIKWLNDNLAMVIESLEQMSADCSKWKHADLVNAETPGPFKYGFFLRKKEFVDKPEDHMVTNTVNDLNYLSKHLGGMLTYISDHAMSDTSFIMLDESLGMPYVDQEVVRGNPGCDMPPVREAPELGAEPSYDNEFDLPLSYFVNSEGQNVGKRAPLIGIETAQTHAYGAGNWASDGCSLPVMSLVAMALLFISKLL